jgi:SPW repeat
MLFPFLARLNGSSARQLIDQEPSRSLAALRLAGEEAVTPHRVAQALRSDPESSRVSVLDVYNLVLAVFLFVSPWLFAYANSAARLDLWASSALIAIVSAAAIAAYAEWEEWLNLALGVWLISAPWILGYAHTRAMHVSIGAGAIVAYLAALRLWLAHYREPTE